jgi:hypothetical protein
MWPAAFIQSCLAPKGVQTFLRVDGARSVGIAVVGNDLSGAEKAIGKRHGVPADAVRVAGA